MYSAKPYDEASFGRALEETGLDHRLDFVEARLTPDTAKLAAGYDAICAFVSDHVDAAVVDVLVEHGVRLVALRCAGYNQVDLEATKANGITVGRVPAYSPHAVAEHAVALILGLARRTHRAYNRVRESNFSLNGLVGFDVVQRTVGVVGTGTIGAVFARIMRGFGCTVLAHDVRADPTLEAAGVTYVERDELLSRADIISLHCPLLPSTHHLIDADAVDKMRPGVMIINTSRGALIDTAAVIEGLKQRKIGHLGLDVYEEEDGVFFEDLSDKIVEDDVLMRLMTFPNVLVTSHQAFLTEEALHNIAETTLRNIDRFAREGVVEHPVT